MSISSKLTQYLHKRRYPELDAYTRDDLAYFDTLFGRAGRTSSFDYLCTILRVEGMTSGHWDAFVEAEEAANNFTTLLGSYRRKKHKKTSLRIGLLLYCHLTEMSAPYEILANLLRCVQGKPYSMVPFSHLVQTRKKSQSLFDKRFLPSPKKKIGHIHELAEACGEARLSELINEFFRDDVRNAFYHSDYAISDDEFRIIEGGYPGKQSIPISDISEILAKSFAFYSAFFITYKSIRKRLAQGRKYHLWPNYEVLELLSDNDVLTGFKIHFPNGSHSMFERKEHEGTTALNISLEKDGVSLFIGSIDDYKKATDWFVDGSPFEEYGTRYNQYGFWRPIVFQGNATLIQEKVRKMTDDKNAQSSLFYILTTGHAAVEFVIKSNKPLFNETGGSKVFNRFRKSKSIEIRPCAIPESSNYIYDCTYFLTDKSLASIVTAHDSIRSFVEKYRSKDFDIKYSLKYQMYSDMSEGNIERNDNGSFSIRLSMDDPRNTLVANTLGVFPQPDWRIKEEWV